LKKIKTSQKRVGGVAQGTGYEFKPQYHKKKKKKRSGVLWEYISRRTI
jgi:hypothetical protein